MPCLFFVNIIVVIILSSLRRAYLLIRANLPNGTISFHRAMLCIERTVLSQDVRMSVWPFRTRQYRVETDYIYHKNFSLSGSHTILVIPHQKSWQYSDEDPITRASNAKGTKKSRFSTNISFYSRNDTRLSHSYWNIDYETVPRH